MNALNVSTLAWFAAMAPAEIPSWFNFTDPHEIPKALGIDEALAMDPLWPNASPGTQKEIRAWLDDGSWDLDGAFEVAVGMGARERIDQRHEEIQRTRDANEAARFYAWRWAYARQMAKGLAASEQNAEFDGVLP
jgi:hypothetical protein